MKYILLIVFPALCASDPASGQYRGGSQDGTAAIQAKGLQHSLPLIYSGGADDGQSSIASSGLNLMPGIYAGGSHDGTAMSQPKGIQHLLPGIYSGGTDDGVSVAVAARQHALPGIYAGGTDDGFALAYAKLQHAGPSIYLGGANDGADMSSPRTVLHQLPAIYAGGAEDGYAISVSLNQNRDNLPPVRDAQRTVALLQLSGAWFNEDAILGWEAAPRADLARFELERSTDGGSHFSVIESIPPNAADGQQTYRYSDLQAYRLPADVVLYRLKSVDRSGDSRYSAIVRLTKDRTAPVIVAYPNPTSGRFTLALLNVPDTRGYSFVLSNTAGKLIKRGDITEANSSFDLSGHAAATYHLFLFKDGKPVQHFTILLTQ